ncbi:MAG: SH3 domain-containing protein [Anaerolineaceae bacterium]|nr:SH3 domain-containing protein [Anaerolineaceae bacterium]
MKIENFKFRILLGVILLLLIIVVWGSMATVSQAADSSWSAEYWNNITLTGSPVLQRTEANLNYSWGSASPAPGIVNSDNFSARWRRSVYFPSGSYRFTATMDDGLRVWVDGVLIIDSWWDSQVHSLTSDVYLYAGDHQIEVQYYDVGGQAVAQLSWAALGGITTPVPYTNWKGEYFNNMNLSGSPALVRDDAAINFNWGSGSPDWTVLPADQFSVRWTRSLAFNSGRYRFTITSDDGARLWVNNQQIINAWSDHPSQTYSGEIDLPGGSVPIKLEYYENVGGAQIQLSWMQVTAVPQPTPPPVSTSATGVVQTGRLNVRYGPGMQYGIITQLTQGQTVSLAGYRSADNHWVMINWGGSTAWVSGLPAYLSTNVPVSSLAVWQGTVPDTGGPTLPTSATGRVANCYYLNLRTGPGVNYYIIKSVPAGAVVTLLGRNTTSTWAKVRLTDGTVGWMNAGYLIKSLSINSLPVVN